MSAFHHGEEDMAAGRKGESAGTVRRPHFTKSQEAERDESEFPSSLFSPGPKHEAAPPTFRVGALSSINLIKTIPPGIGSHSFPK